VPGQGSVRDYPRLKHGGKHLGDDENRVAADAGFTAFKAGMLAFIGWLGVFGVIAAVNRKKARN
jgi:peptide/nickel transport system permease protein